MGFVHNQVGFLLLLVVRFGKDADAWRRRRRRGCDAPDLLSNVGRESIEQLKAGIWCWLRCAMFHLGSLIEQDHHVAHHHTRETETWTNYLLPVLVRVVVED